MSDSKLDNILEMLTTQSNQHGNSIKKIEEVLLQLSQTSKNHQASIHNLENQMG